MICPIMSANISYINLQNGITIDCMEGRCALWNAYGKRCGLAQIPYVTMGEITYPATQCSADGERSSTVNNREKGDE